MIYPWYDEARWLEQVFKGDRVRGERLIRHLCPKGATAYFRESYASFRVNGLEYARLYPRGKVRLGIGRTGCGANGAEPSVVVEALREAFRRIAQHEDDSAAPSPLEWAKTLKPEWLAVCIAHAVLHHQPEHWLESLLIADPSKLHEGFTQLRSQVVVGERGDRRPKFIDLLGLDESARIMWVVEIKEPKADKNAVHQVAEYASWVQGHLAELLEPSNGYFRTSLMPSDVQVGIMLVAPSFSGNVGDYAKDIAADRPVCAYMVARTWRTRLSCQRYELRETRRQYGTGRVPRDRPTRRPPMESYRGRWADCNLVQRLVRTAREEGFVVKEGDPDQMDYINIRGPQSVLWQLHKLLRRESAGVAIVFRDLPADWTGAAPLTEVDDFTLLSGDQYANKPWLRSTGKRFARLPRARCFFAPDSLYPENDEHPVWQAIGRALRYLREGKNDAERG
jgi:hypothetical protein